MTKPDHLRALAHEGFTLVELLIVVIILSILAGILIPQFGYTTDDAKISALDTTLASSRAAIDIFYQHHGYYPSAVTAVGALCGPAGGATGAGLADSEAAFLEHLSLYSNLAGEACTISDNVVFKYGPYMKKAALPVNPLTANAVTVVVTAGLLGMTAGGTTGGWRFDNKTGQFIADHTDWDDH